MSNQNFKLKKQGLVHRLSSCLIYTLMDYSVIKEAILSILDLFDSTELLESLINKNLEEMSFYKFWIQSEIKARRVDVCKNPYHKELVENQKGETSEAEKLRERKIICQDVEFKKRTSTNGSWLV